ncbi:MAG: menaquinone biosynthesis protein [Acidobacteria bacterium]|nr:menaquinone biosynthesis protein [Acidobacteriota bacterium]
MRKKDAPRLAASSYLNTAPLIWSFTHGSMQERVELLTDAAPARCALMLERGQADVALVPVIEYGRMKDVLIVPDVCVGSRERVRSVVLATRLEDLRRVRSISLDTSSRTSAALIQIIFREFFGLAPECKAAAPNLNAMLEESDAALIIGDPAMTFPREGLQVHDLATLWREQTGLGFVFAMWMARSEAIEIARAVDFAGARDEGLAHVEEIAELYQRKLDLPRAELREYLLENISFELDAEMKAGLKLYFELAQRHGFIESAKPLRMLEA